MMTTMMMRLYRIDTAKGRTAKIDEEFAIKRERKRTVNISTEENKSESAVIKHAVNH